MDSTETSVPVCYRHPDRVTGLACSRCEKSICVECSNDAAVGQLCPECAAQTDRHRVVRARSLYQRPSFQTAPVSFTILAVTVGIYVIGFMFPVAGDRLFLNFAQFNVLIDAGEWWRIFTPILLHGSLLHIGFNMYLLYMLGPRLEQQVGSSAFGALYLATAGAGGAVERGTVGAGVVVRQEQALAGVSRRCWGSPRRNNRRASPKRSTCRAGRTSRR